MADDRKAKVAELMTRWMLAEHDEPDQMFKAIRDVLDPQIFLEQARGSTLPVWRVFAPPKAKEKGKPREKFRTSDLARMSPQNIERFSNLKGGCKRNALYQIRLMDSFDYLVAGEKN